MQILATDATADRSLEYLASDGTGGRWTYFANLSEWESLCKLRDEHHFVGRQAGKLRTGGWPKRGGLRRGCNCG